MDYYRAGHYEKGYSDDEYVIRGPNTRRLSRRRMLRDLSSSDPLSSMRLTIMLKHPGQKAAGGTVKKPLDEESVSDGRINIVGSQFRKGGKVVLYRKSPAMTGQVTQFAWIHKQEEPKSLNDFERFATSLSGLESEEVTLITSLFREVRQKEKSTGNGKFLAPMTFCVTGENPLGARDKSALFVNFPYFSIDADTAMDDVAIDPSRHYTQSLLQVIYNLESTRKRDLEQAVRKMRLYPHDHMVHVPQLWAIILDSRLLITYAPISLVKETTPSLAVVDTPASYSPSSPSVLRVTDPDQRIYFLPVEHCKTWFALIDRIENECLKEYRHDKYGFQLFTTDDIFIGAEDWQTLIQGHKSSIFGIQIRLEYPVNEPPSSPRYKGASTPSPVDSTWSESERSSSDTGSVSESEAEEPVDLSTRPGTEPATLVQRVNTWKNDYKAFEVRKKREVDATEEYYSRPVGKSDKPPDLLYVPRNRAIQTIMPTSEGIIRNNARRRGRPDRNSRLYYAPGISSNAKGRQSSKASSPSRVSLRTSTASPRSVNDRKNDGASQTLPSAPVNDPHLRSLTSRIPEAALHVPPVFTWSIEANPEHDGDLGYDGSRAASYVSSGENIDANATKPELKLSILQEEEKVLVGVTNDLHQKLLGSSHSDFFHNPDLYAGSKSTSLERVEVITKDLFGLSIPAMMVSNIEQGDEDVEKSEAPWKAGLGNMARLLLRLLDFFIPLAFPCEVSGKYWGAYCGLMDALPKLCNISPSDSPTQRGLSSSYRILDISGPNDVDLRNDGDLALFDQRIEDCTDCAADNKIYKTRQEALDHLSKHCNAGSDLSLLSAHWIMDVESHNIFLHRKEGLNIIDDINDCFTQLERLALQIKYGVSENGKFDRDTYRIPSCLVDAFERMFMKVILCADMASITCCNLEIQDGKAVPPASLRRSLLRASKYFGCQAEESMHEAKKQIAMMSCTSGQSDIVSYAAVGPEFVLSILMNDLRYKDSASNRVNLVELYQNYILKLQFRVNQQPNRRLLQELQFCSEELQIIGDVAKWQTDTLTNYSEQLNPRNYNVTTKSRMLAFALESDHIFVASNMITDDFNRVLLLLRKVDILSRQTQNGVEVRQEDHGKAIMAFTIVTVFYLPLSFVTSFFGMNTVDVRETTSTQVTYWAVSLPLTVLTIVVALLVGFKAERIQESLTEMFRKKSAPNLIAVPRGLDYCEQDPLLPLTRRSTGPWIKGALSKAQEKLRFREKNAAKDSVAPVEISSSSV